MSVEPSAEPFSQQAFDIRCEWGLAGVEALSPISDAIVLVDVLSFTTCVDIATSNGAAVLPYQFRDDGSVAEYARRHGAVPAAKRGSPGFTLSPASLLDIPEGTRLVLPSPNGATLSLAVGAAATLAGCLRNARAAAERALEIGTHIAVIPCGERWPDGGLRPALEDWLGAGAVIRCLSGRKSPEAQAAQRLFEAYRGDLARTLTGCASGNELIGRGFATDVALAAQLDCSPGAPLLQHGAFAQ